MIPVRDDIRLSVGLPVYGGYHPHFVPGLLRLIQSPPCHLRLLPLVGDSLVSRARNRIAATFLADPDATHLLFLDTDLIFSPDHVARLISHDLPIVAGLYPKKQPGLKWVCNTREAFGGPDPETKLQRVLYAGTGALLIAREVLEKLRELHPELHYDPDAGEPELDYTDFFRVGIHRDEVTGRRRYLSEDWYFCQMAIDAGYQIYADTGVILKHCGDAIYPLVDPTGPEQLAAPAENPAPEPVE